MIWMYSFISAVVASLAFLPSAIGNGEHRPVDPIVAHVARLQPSLKPAQRTRLARAVRAVSNECGMPWELLLSIAFHESSLRVGAENGRTKDYGLTQINEKNILTLRLDRHRLVRDERYALTAACKILVGNRDAYRGKYPHWLGIYRSGTALKRDAVRLNAEKYDRLIRKTAAEMGYVEQLVARK